jgi:hypothetical protein
MSAQRRGRRSDVPALAICANAARTIAGVLQNLQDTSLIKDRALECGFASFSAGCILLIDIWDGKSKGVNERDFQDVATCIRALEGFERG